MNKNIDIKLKDDFIVDEVSLKYNDEIIILSKNKYIKVKSSSFIRALIKEGDIEVKTRDIEVKIDKKKGVKK